MQFTPVRINSKRKNSAVGTTNMYSQSSGSPKIPKIVLGGILLMGVFFLLLTRGLFPEARREGGHLRTIPPPAVLVDRQGNTPSSFTVGVVADLDKKSKQEANGKLKFNSLFMLGKMSLAKNSAGQSTYQIQWEKPQRFSTKINEGGRGFELSELVKFKGELYTVDDRTGVVFRLVNANMANIANIRADPRYVITEGDGNTDKGQKHEWATVKDGQMYLGSIGKEFTDEHGNIVNKHNFWVAIINQDGNVTRVDWTKHYEKMRDTLGCKYPGYLVHEAIEWSDYQRKWFILPRRVSKESYDDMKDELRGSNKILIADEDFGKIEVKTIGKITPARGFSSFKFVPGTEDKVILALKSMENEAEQKQSTYATVFDLDGNILMEETEIPGNSKYEGVVFI